MEEKPTYLSLSVPLGWKWLTTQELAPLSRADQWFPTSIRVRTTRGSGPDGYCSFAYSVLASFRIGTSGSASFQRVRKSRYRSEEHTSELQSLRHLVCRL